MNDTPIQDVVLFDGECNFCKTQIGWIRWLDRGGRYRFLSLHDASIPEMNLGLSFDQMMEEMWIVTPRGDKYGGADAVKHLTRSIPLLYPLAPLTHFPGSLPLWRYLYRTVARLRYRIAGRTCENGTCQIHLDKLSKR